jgi:hypothetical protein
MRLPIYILLMLFVSSCEMVTEITVPETPTAAVINSVLYSDSTWRVAISTNAPILSEIQFPVFNPVIVLTDENGNHIPLTESEWPQTGYDYYVAYPDAHKLYRGTSKPHAGVTYRIEVSGSNIPTAIAETRMPDAIDILDAKFDSSNFHVSNRTDDGRIPLPLEFSFQDPAGQGDYYNPVLIDIREFRVFDPRVGDTVTQTSRDVIQLVKTLASESGFFQGIQNVDMIADIPFDGTLHTVKLYALAFDTRGWSYKKRSLKLYLNHRESEYFQYFHSLELQKEARNNPFAQPVQVYSNIEGGFGVFVGSTSTHWEFVK